MNLKEQLNARDLMRARESYAIGSEPIFREMARVRLLFTRPWMKFDAGGKLVDCGETWTDPGAEKLYAQYGETLRVLREINFGPPTP